MNSSVYAIGLKHYIEFRRSNKPPRVRVSKSVRVATVEQTYREWDNNARNMWGTAGNYVRKTRTVKVKTPITVTDFVGGRFLCSIKRKTASRFIKCGVGQVTEVPPEIAQGLLQKRP
jgi:hypothetical protein